MIKNIAPLNGSFMIASILGVIFSLMYIIPRNATWGFAFAGFFAIMFISAMISMTYGPEEAMLHVGHEKERRAEKRREKQLFQFEEKETKPKKKTRSVSKPTPKKVVKKKATKKTTASKTKKKTKAKKKKKARR